MREPNSRNRTADRDWDIWLQYSDGHTQEQIAEHYGLDQSTISRIITRMRDDIPIEERRARQRRQLQDLDQLREQALQLADASTEDPTGRVRAMDLALKIQEREAKALGTDAAIRISHEAEQAGERIKALLRRVTGPAPGDEPTGDDTA